MKITKLLQDIFCFQSSINSLLQDSSFLECDDFSYKYEMPKTADEFLYFDVLRDVFDKLADVNYDIKYLKTPVKFTGYLSKNENGRYEIDNHEFTSGSLIEFLYFDEYDEVEKWKISRVESRNGEYYIYNFSDVDMYNLQVRVRGY